MNILLCEDDTIIAEGLCYSLEDEGYQVLWRDTVAKAKEALKENEIGLCILDLSLPDGNGFEVCRQAKSIGDIPVIFLTASDDEVNVVMGLDMGADDYIAKPFRVRELLSRIKSVLRRYGNISAQKTMILINPIRINTLEAKVYKHEHEVFLTAMEYRLLLTLVNHMGQVLTRGQLLEGIWDVAGDFVNDNTLTVYIKRLREKLEEDPQNPKIIKTVRGFGYLFSRE